MGDLIKGAVSCEFNKDPYWEAGELNCAWAEVVIVDSLFNLRVSARKTV